MKKYETEVGVKEKNQNKKHQEILKEADSVISKNNNKKKLKHPKYLVFVGPIY